MGNKLCNAVPTTIKMQPVPQPSDRISLIVLGDVPQEPGYKDDGTWSMLVYPVPFHVLMDRNTSFATFQEDVARLPLTRYHLTKHNPQLADALFVPDDEVYPPGLYRPCGEAGKSIRLERNPKRADSAYDDGPGRGWWSAVHDTRDPYTRDKYFNADWRAIDTEEDWAGLMQILAAREGKGIAMLRHLSVKERLDFVQAQLDLEKAYMAEHHGDKLFNFLLERHRDEKRQAEFSNCRDSERPQGDVEGSMKIL